MPQPYKTLVLCFDGTWNTLKSHTNVSRIYSEIADTSTGCRTQRKFYDEGVGTHWYDRFRGGALGFGLDRNIRLGYAWLASVFESEIGTKPPSEKDSATDAEPPSTSRKPNGDLNEAPKHSSGVDFLACSDIYILGFSRGAFTARSLGGMVNYLGIPRVDTGLLKPDTPLSEHPTIKRAWDLYDARPSKADCDLVDSGKANGSLKARISDHRDAVKAFHAEGQFPVRIHFMGVWDTVGALGIPQLVDWLPRPSSKYLFHDTTLGECIRNAFHGMAIDEHRSAYKTTLWTAPKPTTENVEQRWFPGAHADVGGGYPDDLLHALPLNWLASKAASCGLEFVNDRHLEIADKSVPGSMPMAPASFDLDGTEYLSPTHDSYAEMLAGFYSVVRAVTFQGRVFRRMLVAEDGIGQSVDPAAFQKWKADPDYRPPNLAQAGRTDVSFAIARWEAQAELGLQAATPGER